jgi:hypothetical protein
MQLSAIRRTRSHKKREIRLVVCSILLLLFFPMIVLPAGHAATAPVWYADFASGSNDPYFNPPTDSLREYNTCSGTISVVAVDTRGGRYVGYYSSPGGSTDSCREYPLKSFHPYLSLSDFLVELWVYVPSVQVNDWISFITVAFANGEVITVNIWTPTSYRAGQALYVYSDQLFDKWGLYQPNDGTAILVPFDRWVKIGLEVHFRSPQQASSVVVYQDDEPVIKWSPKTVSTTTPSISSLHFGLYTGAQQGPFSIYNSDIAFYKGSALIPLRRS